MSLNTCDLYDRFERTARVPVLDLRDFGGRSAFSGPIVTVKCFEDNSRVKELSATPGRGRVLVVDGGGSVRQALMGDMIAAALASNGWEGVVIWGAVRDVDALKNLDFGIKALAATPRKSTRRGEGQTDLPLSFGGVTWSPGDQLFADRDGVLLLPGDLSAADD